MLRADTITDLQQLQLNISAIILMTNQNKAFKRDNLVIDFINNAVKDGIDSLHNIERDLRL